MAPAAGRTARTGTCYIVGGEEKAIKQLEQFFINTAVPDGYLHTGPAGSGHYEKLLKSP